MVISRLARGAPRSNCSRQRFTLAKMKAYTRNFSLSESTVERGQTALGIPCSDIFIDQRAASAILSTTFAARY